MTARTLMAPIAAADRQPIPLTINKTCLLRSVKNWSQNSLALNMLVSPTPPSKPPPCDVISRSLGRVDLISRSSFVAVKDCPPFPQLAHYALAVAGAALEISRELRDDRADVGIVWDGGRHHAQRSSAAGFCYVNDVALAISELRREPTDPSLQRLDRVLYIDLDLHHGDGVELAFWSTSRVLTVSVHFHDPEGGFYPLTGAVDSCGPAPPSPAASHALNIPLADPLAGSLAYVCTRTLLPLIGAYKPAATLVQCGVDGLAGDPVGGSHWGFGLEEMGSCVGALVKASLAGGAKVLLLGGGGYHTANAARAWAYFTSIALGKPLALSTEIPLGLERAVDYGPSYTLDVPASEKYCGQTKVAGDGTDGKIKSVIEKVERHVEFVREKYRSL